MNLSLGYESNFSINIVCKSKKTLNGLNQYPWVWFYQKMLEFGYKQSGGGDDTLFFRLSSSNKIVIFMVYVDDILITRDDYNFECSSFTTCI